MSESIKVYSRPVDVVNILLPKSLEPQHTFIVYTKSNGDQFIYRGGPENGNMLTDNLKVTTGKYVERAPDYVDPKIFESYQSQTLKTGENLSSIWKQFERREMIVNKMGRDYEPFGNNCNAVVNDALDYIGDKEMTKSWNKFVKENTSIIPNSDGLMRLGDSSIFSEPLKNPDGTTFFKIAA